MRVIKAYETPINHVTPEPFDMPLPLEFELMHGNIIMTRYEIAEDMTVNYSFNPETSERFLTPLHRPLSIKDIYFLVVSRVFPDDTPVTEQLLDMFELDEYNPYDILRKTRGIMPFDGYWFRFEGEDRLTYKKALKEYNSYQIKAYEKAVAAQKKLQEEAQQARQAQELVAAQLNESAAMEPVSDILDQHALHFDALAQTTVGDPMAPGEFRATVIGGNDRDTAVSSVMATDAAVSDAEKMSDDAIAALLAGMGGVSEPEPEPAPAADPNAKMSDDAIAALLAGMGGVSEPEPAPAADPNAKMSDDAIAALLAGMGGVSAPEPAPAPDPKDPNAKMSDDAIAALLAGMSGG